MPTKYTTRVFDREPRYGGKVIQRPGSKYFEVLFRDRPVGRFKTQEQASAHLSKLVEQVQRRMRRPPPR